MLDIYMTPDDCTALARSAEDVFADLFNRYKSAGKVKVEPVKSCRCDAKG